MPLIRKGLSRRSRPRGRSWATLHRRVPARARSRVWVRRLVGGVRQRTTRTRYYSARYRDVRTHRRR